MGCSSADAVLPMSNAPVGMSASDGPAVPAASMSWQNGRREPISSTRQASASGTAAGSTFALATGAGGDTTAVGAASLSVECERFAGRGALGADAVFGVGGCASGVLAGGGDGSAAI